MAERVYGKKSSYAGIAPSISFVEKVLWWLEKDDQEVEKVTAYGLCLATITYFLARLFQ